MAGSTAQSSRTPVPTGVGRRVQVPVPTMVPRTCITTWVGGVASLGAEGLERLDVGTVLTYMPLSVGDQLTAQTSRQAMRGLYASGLFEDVRVRVATAVAWFYAGADGGQWPFRPRPASASRARSLLRASC